MARVMPSCEEPVTMPSTDGTHCDGRLGCDGVMLAPDRIGQGEPRAASDAQLKLGSAACRLTNTRGAADRSASPSWWCRALLRAAGASIPPTNSRVDRVST